MHSGAERRARLIGEIDDSDAFGFKRHTRFPFVLRGELPLRLRGLGCGLRQGLAQLRRRVFPALGVAQQQCDTVEVSGHGDVAVIRLQPELPHVGQRIFLRVDLLAGDHLADREVEMVTGSMLSARNAAW